MIRVTPASSRGATRLDWLDSKHTFSFADYHNPSMMGFGPLRVINEDVVAPGEGFGAHSHRDMEIITYVVQGGLEHRDSLHPGEVINVGEVQRMTAGTGVTHSEFNISKKEPVHFFQIWINPVQRGLKPGYEKKQVRFKPNEWTLLAANAGTQEQDALSIHQDVQVFIARVPANSNLSYTLNGRNAWLQVVSGDTLLDGQTLLAGDGAAIEGETQIELVANTELEVLLFDLPAVS